jgi:aminotransferase
MYLLGQTGVASVPGESFFKGPEGKGIVRFCFAKEDEVIEDACRRLEALHSGRSQKTG